MNSEEIKIYAINSFELEEAINELELTDEEFVEIAEKQGLVWSLSGFEASYNADYISDQWFIRILPK